VEWIVNSSSFRPSGSPWRFRAAKPVMTQERIEGWKLIERNYRFTNFSVRSTQNVADYEDSVLPRKMESNCEGWIAEQIWSWAHASTRVEKHLTFPKDLMIQFTAISRI
jgi:hypothetical protein